MVKPQRAEPPLPSPIPTSRDPRRPTVLPIAARRFVGEAIHEALSRAGLACLPALTSAPAASDLANVTPPDVVVVDVSHTQRDPARAIRPWLDLRPPPRVIALDAAPTDRCLRRCLLAGARAYLVLADSESTIVEAVHAVLEGRLAVSPTARPRLIAGHEHPPGFPLTRGDLLSPRERQVLSHIAEGRSKREIADTLDVSIKTVEKHSTSLMRKLDLHNRVEVARYAVREGIAER